MKFTIEHELLSAQTDSVEVAERLILIIKNMEKVKDPAIEAYLGEYNLPAQPFKGAIVVDEPEQPIVNPQTKREFAEIMAKRTKKDTPAMNITSRLHEEPADIDDEEIEIDTVPADDDPTPEIPHGQKIKSEDIQPAEGTVEEAYMGEHFEIQPKDPDEKPLTPAEQELWDYIQANPDYTMSGACRALKITTANYYWRKRQLFLKGKPVGGTIPFAKKAED